MTELVNITIDGAPVEVPKGTLIIRAAEQAGIRIPRFCDHPLLAPSANCRQCLVDVAMPGRDGVVRPMPKPQPSCAMTVMEGMEVNTQATSEVAAKAQAGTMEFLLINHPLDCPVCDKGGECPLQNQAMSAMAKGGQSVTRFTDVKRTFPKPLRLTSQILLDRDRCILCQRCVRFAKQIPGDPFIDLQGRGGGHPAGEHGGMYGEQIGRFDAQVLDFHDPGNTQPTQTLRGQAGLTPADELTAPDGSAGAVDGLAVGPVPVDIDNSGRPFASYFAGNIIQICPVGALTSATYRFRARPMDLVSTDTVSEHDASGSAMRVDMRRGVVLRRMAGNDSAVNEEWITDKDRFAFTWATASDRLTTPLVRDDNGELQPASWGQALAVASKAIEAARGTSTAFLTGGRLTLEDAWAYSRFARTVSNTNNIDERVRTVSREEESFIATYVAGTGLGKLTYEHLEKAGTVLLVGLEPEDECGSIFLRLRKGVLAGGVKVATVAPMTTPSSIKMRAQVINAVPGQEAAAVATLATNYPELAEDLKADGATILVGERAAAVPGLLSVVDVLARATGALVGWVPRRAGDRGAIEAGLLPGLLPGGRQVCDDQARAEVAKAWGVDELPTETGANLTGILAGLANGTITTVVAGGVDLRDMPDPQAARAAFEKADALIQFEVRSSGILPGASVVFPVAPPVEKNGTFVNWEGRVRPFGQAHVSCTRTDRQVLAALADKLGVDLEVNDLAVVHEQIAALGITSAQRPGVTFDEAQESVLPEEISPAVDSETKANASTTAILAMHKPMLDAGRMQDGERYLALTARRPAVFLASDVAIRLGVSQGDMVEVSTSRGSITLPARMSDLVGGCIWMPECSEGSTVRETLGVDHGATVTVSSAKEVAQ
ncbi:NADH-quinone oxidoreductase subunit G [Actinomyces vulturis]|uniref:NADH-quinone oxidoreductase subunit G n=1 Tax=Actinomyces vulturis TaxID=1857645 RepID=UPI0008304A47|nr:NADH-quinone oxidoreductase subunit G [Actinomyces vulturis]